MLFKSRFTLPAVAAISFCLIGGTVPAVADIIHVPGDFPTIQEAIDAAMDGDEVEVHPGTYNETINFLGKAITLRSSDGPEVTTIDGTGFLHVVQCVSGEGLDTVLDGFTITGGNAEGPCCGSDMRGGGMYNENSSPTVTNCTFSGNTAFGFGGGMHNTNSNPTVTNCTFIANSAGGGGGMDNEQSSPTVTNCTFTGNTAEFFGGGMGNVFESSPTVTNCTFTGNTTEFFGGGMFNAGSPTVTNCTFSGNTATLGGGGMANVGSPTVTNCILWGDSPNETIGGTVTFSDVQGGFPGIGNIDADPLFVAPGIDDYRLSTGSPCIDAADNTAVPKGIDIDLDGNPRFVDDPDTDDTGNGDPPIVDMGAYEFQGIPCPWDVNGDGVVDHHDLVEVVHNLGPCDDPDNCPWDINGDGIVNGRDVAAVAMHFGPCP